MSRKANKHVRLQDYADQRGLTNQRAIAEHFGVSQTTILRWLRDDALWVELTPGGHLWKEIYTEKVLLVRGG